MNTGDLPTVPVKLETGLLFLGEIYYKRWRLAYCSWEKFIVNARDWPIVPGRN